MIESFSKLNNLHVIRKLAREYGFEAFNDITDKFITVKEELEKEEALRLQKEEENKQAIQDIIDEMEKKGVSAEALMSSINATPKSKRNKRPAKYRYVNENGDEALWTGQGRTPKIIQDALDSGKALADFLIT